MQSKQQALIQLVIGNDSGAESGMYVLIQVNECVWHIRTFLHVPLFLLLVVNQWLGEAW